MDVVDDDGLRTSVSAGEYTLDELAKLRRSMLLAAFACILRPTNLLVWLSSSVLTILPATSIERKVLFREAILLLALSILVDRLYYQTWTFPPLRFLYFNIAQSLAAFYGKNRWDYYFTEGLPLLLTTALPFAVAGLWQALQPLPQHPPPNLPGSEARKALLSKSALRVLALVTVFFTVVLSLVSHKEVRFIYPLLPILHLLSAHPLAAFFRPLPKLHWKALLLVAVLLFNIGLSQYVSLVHQRGVIDVLSFLRHEQEAETETATANGGAHGQGNITVAFLMPCHSTPWRSHLVYPSIDAWALTCEPPLDVPLDQRHAYRDEADQFYDDPEGWLSANMQGPATTIAATKSHGAGDGRRPWPRYLVFFEQLEPTSVAW
ncbi:hypothetical protein B0A49_00461 [Cryomyces minteri]|uniref:Mannosyltransferase n=1 Tax=Cryomyces minteri TaxID=331657 RepID=A0A4U0XVA0_9PEZI|nr:hypothetical protein B0A49_00735 [Cryomyces minteri]TKA81704.1 hypothetical protein B0A49_00461 [Cryomyces minteri]